MEITVQYFDGCPNWRIADAMLTEIAAGRRDVTITRMRVETPEEAESLGFRGSPTILVDGTDPFADAAAPIGLTCRVYRTPEGMAGSPTLDQLRRAISLRLSACGDRRAGGATGSMPEAPRAGG